MTTAIEWTDETWNPTTGCDRCSPGCDHCYIERTVPFRIEGRRFDEHGKMGVRLHPDRLDKPLHWRKPRRVFVNSLSDLFHPDVPSEFIARCFATMAAAERHTFQVLTKRPQRMARLVGADGFMRLVADALHELQPSMDGRWATDGRWPLPNVWLGTSVENQRYADLRIPHLQETPAAVRFLSMEPLLGPVDLRPWLRRISDEAAAASEYEWDRSHRIDWIICGGESGPGARPMDPAWVRDLRDRCVAAGVPFFLKQWGGRTPKANGRKLDWRTWDEYPAERSEAP